MNHIEAIRKLIDRNKSLVRRKGVSDYTKETDTIINALLTYMRETDNEIKQLRPIEKHRDVVFTLFGFPDELKNVDIDFLERYINYEFLDGAFFLNGFIPDDFEITPQYIIRKFNHTKIQICAEWDLYKYAVDKSIITLENYMFFEKALPYWVTWFKYNYSEKEIKEILKREKYFDYERITR